jgi:hypothetical protein
VPVVVLNFGALEDLVRNRLAIGVNSLNPEEIAGTLLKATGRSPPRFPKGTNTFLEWPEYSKRIIDTYYELLENK